MDSAGRNQIQTSCTMLACRLHLTAMRTLVSYFSVFVENVYLSMRTHGSYFLGASGTMPSVNAWKNTHQIILRIRFAPVLRPHIRISAVTSSTFCNASQPLQTLPPLVPVLTHVALVRMAPVPKFDILGAGAIALGMVDLNESLSCG